MFLSWKLVWKSFLDTILQSRSLWKTRQTDSKIDWPMRLQLVLRNLKTTEQMSGSFKLQGNFVCYLLSYWLKILNQLKFFACSGTRTTVAQWSLFSSKSQTFWAWADNLGRILGGIWGIFGQFISTHFGTVSTFSIFSNYNPLIIST